MSKGRDLGIHRRSEPNHKLQNQTSTLYHSGKGTSNILANVTMATGNNDMIISLDHFAEELNTINCEPDARKLTLTFDNKEVYDNSVDDWEWVNFETERTFIMLVNGCQEKPETIEPWVISNATYDDAHFTVVFAGERKEWAELPNEYTIDFEPAEHPADVAARLARRWDPIGWVKDKANDAKEAAEKLAKEAEQKVKDAANKVAEEAKNALSAEGDLDFNIPMKVPFPSTIVKKEEQSGLTFGVECKDCGMQGGIDVKGHIKVALASDDKVPEFYIDIMPKGLRADINLELDVAGTLDPNTPWTKELPFPDAPLPGFGIKGIAELGPVLGLKAGIKLTKVKGTTLIKTGVAFLVNDDAKTRLNIVKGKDGESKDWNPRLEQKDPELNSPVDGEFETYLLWDLGIEASIMKNKIPGAGLTMKAPMITLKTEATFENEGACNTTDNYAVNLAMGMGIDVGARAYYGMRGQKEEEFWKKQIFAKDTKDMGKFYPSAWRGKLRGTRR
ncbi:hypothetical protein M7I_2104 [Glarea lozoyensis 74030]|uniref:Uncharacterized protein n=1 Tax=Glarea lozoyensis (strain ATCC 74030 / MF5533) TaxID=1104152 RepID=H0EHW3_GLAL7|nr:hypothetical protein M7I_2104 [Glarea lozoyensis 74030]